ISIEEIDAVFITHEHSDHIYGVEVLSRNYNIPVYSNQLTTDSILARNYIKCHISPIRAAKFLNSNCGKKINDLIAFYCIEVIL
ncbi:MAG: MBL fold metallo-hydrolase, partial [Bacillota bacterium]|nr:MBL fold metallo-hydrolase [Bacillota bacterium]